MRYLRLVLTLTVMISASAAVSGEPPRFNRVELTESARALAENDRLVVEMYAQAEAAESAEAADTVNRNMTWAIEAAKQRASIELQTLGFRTNAIYHKNKVRGWRVSQSLRLESTDSRELGELVATLQQKLNVRSVVYRISEEQRRRHIDALTTEALQRFQRRAEQIARTLGYPGYRLVRLRIDEAGKRPAPVMRALALEARAESAPARLEAGTQVLTVSVDGEIELEQGPQAR